MLQANDTVPAFEARDENGNPFTLATLLGKKVVVFFYPKADTPGCTKEACGFRDANEQFTGANAVLVGVSPDAGKAQNKFKAKFNLPFTLLADTEHAVADAFGVWGEKTFMGRSYMGVSRSTFIIGVDGKIAHVFPKATPEDHADEVFEALKWL